MKQIHSHLIQKQKKTYAYTSVQSDRKVQDKITSRLFTWNYLAHNSENKLFQNVSNIIYNTINLIINLVTYRGPEFMYFYTSKPYSNVKLYKVK